MESLRADRIAAGLTQDELAQLSGVGQATISTIENGKSSGYHVREDLRAALEAAAKHTPQN